MDIVRDESVKKRKRQKQTIMIVIAVIAVLGVTLGVSNLNPHPQALNLARSGRTPSSADRCSTGHGLGTLVPTPADIRLIPAETDVRLNGYWELPGTPVKAETIIMELSNPQVEQEAMDADLQVKSALADYQNTKVKSQRSANAESWSGQR